jgi:hypothetical protein
MDSHLRKVNQIKKGMHTIFNIMWLILGMKIEIIINKKLF